MSDVHELIATNETFHEVAELLYGGGGGDLLAQISKANPTQSDLATKQRQKRQAQVGLASNILGLAAGGAGTAAAYKEFAGARRAKKGLPEKPPGAGKLAGKLRGIKGKHAVGLAGGALGLQLANVGGDVVANRVLSREAKKKPVSKSGRAPGMLVKKDLSEIPEMATTSPKKQLTRAALTSAPKAAGKGLEYTKKGGFKRLPSKVETKVKKREAEDVEVVWSGEIAKALSDKQQVFGWASVVEVDGEPVMDLQGDVITPDEMEKAAYSYVQKSRKGGDMHLRDNWQPIQKSEMIESFIVTDDKRQAMGLPDSVPTGWWVGFQVQDPQVWADVKAGKRTGFSIHGTGKRTPA